MVDEEKNVNKPDNSQETQEESSPKQESSEDKGQSWQELAGVDPNEFDAPEKLAKSYKDARRGLSEQGEKLKEAEQFRSQAEPVLRAIYGNPDLYKQVVEQLTPKEEKREENTAQPDTRIDEMQAMEESRVIGDFESSINLTKKSKEDQDQIRSEVGKIMKRWIPQGSRPSLQQLGTYLEDAWKIYKTEHDVEEEQDDKPNLSLGFGTPRAAQAALEKLGVDALSPEERKAASRMGLTVEEYLKEKKEIVSE